MNTDVFSARKYICVRGLASPKGRGGGGVGYCQKYWVGVCGPLPKTLTLIMTDICVFPYPIYDLTPVTETCLIIISLVQTNVKGNARLSAFIR